MSVLQVNLANFLKISSQKYSLKIGQNLKIFSRSLKTFKISLKILKSLEIYPELFRFWNLVGNLLARNKASGHGLLFFFILVRTSHAHFQNRLTLQTGRLCRLSLSWEPTKPSTVFFRCEMSGNTARKAGFKVCGEMLCPVYNSKKKPAFEKSLPISKCNTGFIY